MSSRSRLSTCNSFPSMFTIVEWEPYEKRIKSSRQTPNEFHLCLLLYIDFNSQRTCVLFRIWVVPLDFQAHRFASLVELWEAASGSWSISCTRWRTSKFPPGLRFPERLFFQFREVLPVNLPPVFRVFILQAILDRFLTVNRADGSLCDYISLFNIQWLLLLEDPILLKNLVQGRILKINGSCDLAGNFLARNIEGCGSIRRHPQVDWAKTCQQSGTSGPGSGRSGLFS